MLSYCAVLVETRCGRAGFVIAGDVNHMVSWVGDKKHVGYVGCASFEEAVRRAGMMERDEPGAWGPSYLWKPPLAPAAVGGA